MQQPLISYISKRKKKKKKKRKRKKKICNKSVKLHFYCSTQKHDDSITRYFPFSERYLTKKLNFVFT